MTDQPTSQHTEELLKARGIDLQKKTSTVLQTRDESAVPQRQQITTTRPSPLLWRPESHQRYRLSPWGVATPLILLSISINTLFAGVVFSFGAFLIEFGLILWLVIALRRGLDQPYASLLWPAGLLSVLAGVDWIADIPFLASLLIISAIWLLWRQFDRVNR